MIVFVLLVATFVGLVAFVLFGEFVMRVVGELWWWWHERS